MSVPTRVCSHSYILQDVLYHETNPGKDTLHLQYQGSLTGHYYNTFNIRDISQVIIIPSISGSLTGHYYTFNIRNLSQVIITIPSISGISHRSLLYLQYLGSLTGHYYTNND